VTYFAAAVARTGDGWVGQELDLAEAEDLDGLTDLLRQVGDDADGTRLLFVEQDDEWFGILRVDGDSDPRVFLSDGRAVEQSDIAAMLYEEAADEVLDDEDEEPSDDDDEAIRPAGEPVGDAELLADLGTPGEMLLELNAEEGMLPADVISAVCEKAGCLDQLDALREG
jgi:putative tRNA adenosine deaminase-associated protein